MTIKNKSALAMITALMLTFTACGSTNHSGATMNKSVSDSQSAKSAYADFADEAEYSDEDYTNGDQSYAYAENTLSTSTAETPLSDSQKYLAAQKMVYTGTVDLETLEYDDAVSRIRNDIAQYGGFIESSGESNQNKRWYFDDETYESERRLSLTVRIPSEHFDEFLAGLSAYGQKMHESTNAENISRRYADNEAEIAALEKEQERLLEMMDNAVTIDEMITVEDRLTSVQAQLNRYKSDRSAMDTDVAYSKINLTLTEVHKLTPIHTEPEPEPTFLERLGEQIKESGSTFLEVLEGLLFLFIALFPYLAILAVIIIIVVSATRKRRAKKAAMTAQVQAQPKPEEKDNSEKGNNIE